MNINFKDYLSDEEIKEIVIDELRKKGEFNDCNSLAYDILEKYVEENKNIIEDKIKNIFSELSKTDLKYEIQDILENYIEKLFLKESGE